MPITNNDEPESLYKHGKDEAKLRFDVCNESRARTESRESEEKNGIDRIN